MDARDPAQPDRLRRVGHTVDGSPIATSGRRLGVGPAHVEADASNAQRRGGAHAGRGVLAAQAAEVDADRRAAARDGRIDG